MVQLAGLEPATSCSTNRRSNQLSYNCILTAPKPGSRTGGKLGATLRFGKTAKRLKSMNLASKPAERRRIGSTPAKSPG